MSEFNEYSAENQKKKKELNKEIKKLRRTYEIRKLQKRVEKLREALKFYATEWVYDAAHGIPGCVIAGSERPSEILKKDLGEKAIQALEQDEERSTNEVSTSTAGDKENDE